MCELGACFLYFSYVLAQDLGWGGETRHPFHPLDPPLFVHLLICDGFVGLQRVCSDRAAVPKKKNR